jgi:hypothetical protein
LFSVKHYSELKRGEKKREERNEERREEKRREKRRGYEFLTFCCGTSVISSGFKTCNKYLHPPVIRIHSFPFS